MTSFADDEAQQALALDGSRRRRMPQLGQVLAQALQGGAVGIAQHQRLLLTPPLVALLDRLDGAQLLLPGTLQRTRHQTVLRLDRVVLAPCPLGLVASALATQTPLLLELGL